jgi:hypothetical protein
VSGPPRLERLPGTFEATRLALHRVAEQIVAPARKPHNEIALMQTAGGFGTPEFEFEAVRMQVRVDGAELVVTSGGGERRTALASLADAAAFVGPELFPDGVPGDDTPLDVDPEAARRLGDFYEFGRHVLETVREGLAQGADPSGINLWPEHFDIAFEAGSEAAGERANYGASPGDEDHREPYLYVGPWSAKPEGELWNATGFTGAELAYSDLVAVADQPSLAVDFMAERYRALVA